MKGKKINILQNNFLLVLLTLFTIFSLCKYLVDNDIKNFVFLMLILIMLSFLTDNLIVILCISILITNLLIDVSVLEGAKHSKNKSKKKSKKKEKKEPEKTPEEIKKETETNLYSLYNSQNRDIKGIEEAIKAAEDAGHSSNTLQILEDARNLVNSLKPDETLVTEELSVEKNKNVESIDKGFLYTIKDFLGL